MDTLSLAMHTPARFQALSQLGSLQVQTVRTPRPGPSFTLGDITLQGSGPVAGRQFSCLGWADPVALHLHRPQLLPPPVPAQVFKLLQSTRPTPGSQTLCCLRSACSLHSGSEEFPALAQAWLYMQKLWGKVLHISRALEWDGIPLQLSLPCPPDVPGPHHYVQNPLASKW